MSRRKTNRIEEVEVTGIAHKSYVVGRTDEGLVVLQKMHSRVIVSESA